jgi:Fe-S-cluster-containing hydrogenase component 2
MCTGCSLCWDLCPRGGLRYEATWPEGVSLDGGQRRVVKVSLNGLGARLLRVRKVLPVALTVKQGSLTVRRQRVVFRAPRAKQRKRRR